MLRPDCRAHADADADVGVIIGEAFMCPNMHFAVTSRRQRRIFTTTGTPPRCMVKSGRDDGDLFRRGHLPVAQTQAMTCTRPM